MCPDGNQIPQFQKLVAILDDLCGRIARAYLTPTETHQAVYQRLEPKLAYPLHLTSFDKKQCRTLNGKIRNAILPKIRMNRNAPGAVVYGPLEMGGMEMLEIYTKQTQLQVPYIMKQLRNDKTVATAMHVLMANTQLRSGLVKPIFDSIDVPVTYMGNYFLMAVRERMAEIGATMWVEDLWVPKLQREGDKLLMERFVMTKGMTKTMLRQENDV